MSAVPGRSKLSKLAFDFIIHNRSASLATTSDDGRPHIAIVYCMVQPDLSIYFTTRAEGRKYDNLIAHPAVAMMFSGHDSLQQLQLSGIAEQIADQDEELDLLHELWKRRYNEEHLPRPTVDLLEPGIRKEYVVFRITPTEMTYANFQTNAVGRYRPDFKKII